jgi:hypothetical protein
VDALVAAWRYTGSARYARQAVCAYRWFLGRNRASARLYAEKTGGCHDGLSAIEPNLNQGAESTLAYYQALLSVVGAGLATLPDRVAVKPSDRVAVKATGRAPSGGRLATTGGLTAAGTLSTTGSQTTAGSLGATARRPTLAAAPVSNRKRAKEGPTDAR